MNIQKDLSVATEAIDFQGDSFFQELLADLKAFNRADRVDMKHEGWSKLEGQWEKTIVKRTGLPIAIALNADSEHMILTPVVDWSHVFHITQVDQVANPEEAFKFFQKAGKEMKSSVDLKKGFVSGTLAKELQAHLEMNRTMLYRKVLGTEFTDEETVAMLLHEIGHFFTQLEFLDRSVATNQVMAELSRNLLHEKEPSKRETVIKTAGKELNLDRNVLERIVSADDKTVTTVLFTTGMKNIRTQSGHSFYDMNTWEMLADQYAARHGAGKHLFTAIHKMVTWMPDMSMESRSAFYFQQVASFVGGLIMFGIAGFALASGSIIYGLVGVLLGIAGVTNTHTSANEPVYDNDYSRLKRIRNQNVQAIKIALGRNKSKFNQAYVASLTSEVKVMDEVLSKGRDQPTAVARLAAFFSASEANRQANTAFQKELESLAHNDLYAQAAAFKTI